MRSRRLIQSRLADLQQGGGLLEQVGADGGCARQRGARRRRPDAVGAEGAQVGAQVFGRGRRTVVDPAVKSRVDGPQAVLAALDARLEVGQVDRPLARPFRRRQIIGTRAARRLQQTLNKPPLLQQVQQRHFAGGEVRRACMVQAKIGLRPEAAVAALGLIEDQLLDVGR